MDAEENNHEDGVEIRTQLDERVCGDEDETNASEVDVTTVTNEELATENVVTDNVAEEFIGSSLSGKSIYAPPRVRRVSGSNDVVKSSSNDFVNRNNNFEGPDSPDLSDDLDDSQQTSSKSNSETSPCSGSGGGSAEQSLPEWKRKIVEKRRTETREKEREKEKWESIPAWRRKLLETKTSREKAADEAPPTSTPNVGEGPASGARFWGVTLKKTQGASDQDVRRASEEEEQEEEERVVEDLDIDGGLEGTAF